MTRWATLGFLLLTLLCISNAQWGNNRRRWSGRFSDFDDYEHMHAIKQQVTNNPRYVVLAPALLRTDSQENLFLQTDGLTSPVTVSISILEFITATSLMEDSVDLNAENGFHALKTIKLPLTQLKQEGSGNRFVNLKVDFGGLHTVEKTVMVSFQSGYIFIQTDKPIYNPGDNVRFRAFVSSPNFKALDTPISMDIQNTDGVVVKQAQSIRAVEGVYGDTFTLSEMANEGTWTVVAKFDDREQNKFTSTFEVKKYVLPAFNVTLTPKKTFLDLDDTELQVEISARYLYGEPVQGTAYVVFGVTTNNNMIRLPSVKQVSDLEGGVVSLSMAELKTAYPNYRSLVGKSVYVKASVLTKSGSDLVEAEKTGIKIVESPYVITFKDTPKYFKPGLPFDITLQVSHHDGSPARNVPVTVNLIEPQHLLVAMGTIRTSINMPKEQQAQTITAVTTKADLRAEQQARQQITVDPFVTFNSQNRNYLYISTATNRVSVGETLSVKMSVHTANEEDRQHVKHITYMVLNKGRIVEARRLNVVGQLVTGTVVEVTADMLPSFRFVAFYSIPWEGQEEVVPEALWVDVVDTCAGGLKVQTVGPPRDYQPGRSFSFQIRGDPGSKVSLVAVDNAVYLLNKARLTQNKLWGVVERGDMGCTRGSGRDAGDVFTNAGLLYASSAGFETANRQALQCPSSARRRRSAAMLQRKAQLELHYKEQLQKRCCKDGLREILMPYSCTRRSLYITEGWECMKAFRYCCSTYRDQVFNTEIPTVPPPMTTPPPTTIPPTTTPPTRPTVDDRLDSFRFTSTGRYRGFGSSTFSDSVRLSGPDDLYMYTMVNARSEIAEEIPMFTMAIMETGATGEEEEEEGEDEDGEYLDRADVYLRSKFYESWLWTDVKLPSQAERDGLSSRTMTHPLPDSITEWGVMAVSASPHTGICVAEPYNVRAWKEFFVDLKLPHSVARNEQVQIKAVIYNYGSEEMRVRVVLMKTEDMCSVAFRDSHTQHVTVAAGSSVAVPYTLVPLSVGKLPLEVMVVGRDLTGGDRVQKFLRVVTDGVQKTEVWSEVLDPTANGGTQTVQVRRAELKSVVPNSLPETFINVRGNVLADSMENSLAEDSLASLLRMPGGCVEQNLASMTLPLIASLYLDRTGGWEGVGVDRRAEGLRYIRRGYENQLAYRRSDGSYPPYRGEGASTWITAYVVKVFSMAHSVTGVNEQQVCDPLLYLVKNKNTPAGSFREDNPVYDTTMTGGLRGDDPELTLTSFVLIALAEAQQARIRCPDPEVDVEEVMGKTVAYIQRSLLKVGRRPYTVAIATYALALLGKVPPGSPTLSLLAGASPDDSHWPDSKNKLFTLEGTGYALLALVKAGRLEEAAAPFKWLNGQRRMGGGYGSTQSTMVVLQALSEYLINKPPPKDLNLDVDIRLTGRKELRYNFNPKTSYAARSSRLPADLDLEVEARGNGQGILEVVTYYNQLHEADEKKTCPHFELSVTLEDSSEKPPADVEKSYQFTIKVRALGPRDVRMVVLDISLPTGFTPENSDLEMLSNSVDRYINNFQIVDNLSDRGSLIIHLFKVSHKEPEILIFRLQQSFKVGLLQPSAVTVYEYYNPDHRCSRTFTPKEDTEELTQICRENVCRCTQGDCCVSKSDSVNIPSAEREKFACTSLHHVFKVKVLGVSQSYYDKYEMEITQVIKLGLEAGVEAGQRRSFLSHGGCRDALALKPNREYLVIGPREDRWDIDSDTNRYIYMLGKNTWVERWPSSTECFRDSSLKDKCKSLEDTAFELSVNSCRG